MLEAVDQVPVVDIYEQLLPESKRVNQRVDFVAWFLAYAGVELRSLGFGAEKLALLADVQSSPKERWPLVSELWPLVRTTGTGRIILRTVWELFGAEEINERTWMDISARMWQISETGFYQDLLHGKANVQMTRVDNMVDPHTRSCCAPIQNYDPYVLPTSRADVERMCERASVVPSATTKLLDNAVAKCVQQDVQAAYVAFKLGTLPAFEAPSPEEVEWALTRVFWGEEPARRSEPSLHSYLVDRFLYHVGRTEIPVQVGVRSPTTIDRLDALAAKHEKVRFVALFEGGADPLSLLQLARTRPNVTLAVCDLWRIAPYTARQVLRVWLYGVPLNKLFAVAGGTTMVEATCAQAMIVREQMAGLLADMVAAGDLDERDANLTMEHLLYKNAREFFRLSTLKTKQS